ncbi:TetR/AcrR family transcriptional regulator C-terminal domain-containing protein [Leucobacter allii]|uniref:TetR/AcrR family transcriptional regulator C-terminal domain-containing protein n=1 Tax=Leucobacter allii TaxID=2932247 RepID=A0ABY4FMJ7_9MICO|nr:TetR/AcrR family transcriptional regulator C-terminal domain-containing protein [Leucobacter allii]UOQ57473.1 TetR/AcrR family transcriptional regulator C-terminal domain-containing protein [Leucobacter allii]
MPRGRPRKALLSVDLIVDTAMRQIDAGEQLSMSRVARELGVHVSSLYNHVDDRDGLIELLRLRIAHEYPVPPLDGLSWQQTLRAIALTIHDAFAAHPRLIPYLAVTPVSSPEIVEIYARLAEIMLDAGHRATSASLAIRMIDSLALGTALVNSTDAVPWKHTTPGGRALLEASEHWEDELAQTAEAFTRGLDYIVSGLEAELAARETAPRG